MTTQKHIQECRVDTISLELTKGRITKETKNVGILVAVEKLSTASTRGSATAAATMVPKATSLGMGSALETLCGQAFGAGQIHMLGIYMQRSCIVLLVTCFLLLPVYIFATPVLKFIGQEDDIADLAGEFTLQIIPHLFSFSLNFPSMKFLQAQRKLKVLTWIQVLAFTIHIGLLFFFIYGLGWGALGAAVAYNITRWGMAIAQVVYVVVWCNEGWTGFSWLAFKDMRSFVRLSIASALMLCLEIWYMMSMMLLTGNLSDLEKHRKRI